MEIINRINSYTDSHKAELHNYVKALRDKYIELINKNEQNPTTGYNTIYEQACQILDLTDELIDKLVVVDTIDYENIFDRLSITLAAHNLNYDPTMKTDENYKRNTDFIDSKDINICISYSKISVDVFTSKINNGYAISAASHKIDPTACRIPTISQDLYPSSCSEIIADYINAILIVEFDLKYNPPYNSFLEGIIFTYNKNRIPLMQYANLRHDYYKLTETVLGDDYYTKAIDVYGADNEILEDIISRFKQINHAMKFYKNAALTFGILAVIAALLSAFIHL